VALAVYVGLIGWWLSRGRTGRVSDAPLRLIVKSRRARPKDATHPPLRGPRPLARSSNRLPFSADESRLAH
jgi:hypothetical protein